MAAKTFTAKSIQAAISQIKSEMGADAMILSTRRLTPGPRDPYGSLMFEVTAAFSEDTEAAIPLPGAVKATEKMTSRAKGAAGNESAGEPVPAWDEIRSELVSIKDMLFVVNQTGVPDFLRMHPECLNLYARLVRAGVSEHRVRRFLEKADRSFGSQPPREIAAAVMQEIISTIAVCDPFSLDNGSRQVAAFIGPTGVGKTTTIAKLSAELSIKHKKRVGVISIDSYRIGAVDQLRTYAEIMGLPCLPAFSAEDFQRALARLENREIILVDTAGQSHLDLVRMRELGRLMTGNTEICTHLVLSATAKQADMREAAQNFATLSPKSYVFTKVDETRTRGGLIDQIMDLNIPVSYVTNGQRVPEDILRATKKRILQLVLDGH